MNKNNTTFKQYDDKLNLIEHYQKFPAMKPYIGNNYGKHHKKLILIGESHYLPKHSTIHLKAEEWYNASQEYLSPEEIEWINTRKILESNWNSRGHFLFKELERRMTEVLGNTKCRAMTNAIFINGFQRPSIEGESIKKIAKKIDYEKSIDILKNVIEIFEPEQVVFVTKFTWDNIGKKISKPFKNDIAFDFVYHPAAYRYWYKYPNGIKKFKDIIKKIQ